MLHETGAAALAALEQSPPRDATAHPWPSIATAAYARVPTVGPRDLQTGHRIVELLSMLDEAGARELVRLRERAYYAFARARIAKVLARQAPSSGRRRKSSRTRSTVPSSTRPDDVDRRRPVRRSPRVSGDLRRVERSGSEPGADRSADALRRRLPIHANSSSSSPSAAGCSRISPICGHGSSEQ